MEAGLGASAAVLGLAGGAAGLYRLVRPRFLYKVNCHFCCRDSMVGHGERTSFLCVHCDQHNGWDSSGDSTAPPLAPPSARYVRDQRPPASPSNGLCRSCNLNQELKVAQLAASRSEGEELEEYSRHLERAYRLCAGCQEELATRLGRQDVKLAPLLLQHRLERSRLERSFRAEGADTKTVLVTALRSLATVLQGLLSVLLLLMVIEQYRLLDTLASSHHLFEGLYLLSDALCLHLPTHPFTSPLLLCLLVALSLLPHCLPSLPRTATSLPCPRDSFSLSLSSLPSPELPGREGTIPSLLDGSVWGEEPNPPSHPVALTSPPSHLVARPSSPSYSVARPNPPSQPVARLFSSPSTPSCPPQPLKTRDEVTINHEFALDTSSSDCDLSILSLGSPATRSPSPRPPFPAHHYSPQPSSLSLFSPPRSLLRPSRLKTSWVAGGYWTPPSHPQSPLPPSRSSSQSSGFVSGSPSVANYFSPSQQGSVLSYGQAARRTDCDRFSLVSEPLFAPSLLPPSPPASLLGSRAFSPPRRPTLEDTFSDSSDRDSQAAPHRRTVAAPALPDGEGAKAWTLTITLTPGGVLLALSVAVNVALALLWTRQE